MFRLRLRSRPPGVEVYCHARMVEGLEGAIVVDGAEDAGR